MHALYGVEPEQQIDPELVSNASRENRALKLADKLLGGLHKAFDNSVYLRRTLDVCDALLQIKSVPVTNQETLHSQNVQFKISTGSLESSLTVLGGLSLSPLEPDLFDSSSPRANNEILRTLEKAAHLKSIFDPYQCERLTYQVNSLDNL